MFLEYPRSQAVKKSYYGVARRAVKRSSTRRSRSGIARRASRSRCECATLYVAYSSQLRISV